MVRLVWFPGYMDWERRKYTWEIRGQNADVRGARSFAQCVSLVIIGVMRLSYNERAASRRAVPDGRFQHHLFQAVFMRTTYSPFGWSRVYTAVESAVIAPVGMREPGPASSP